MTNCLAPPVSSSTKAASSVLVVEHAVVDGALARVIETLETTRGIGPSTSPVRARRRRLVRLEIIRRITATPTPTTRGRTSMSTIGVVIVRRGRTRTRRTSRSKWSKNINKDDNWRDGDNWRSGTGTSKKHDTVTALYEKKWAKVDDNGASTKSKPSDAWSYTYENAKSKASDGWYDEKGVKKDGDDWYYEKGEGMRYDKTYDATATPKPEKVKADSRSTRARRRQKQNNAAAAKSNRVSECTVKTDTTNGTVDAYEEMARVLSGEYEVDNQLRQKKSVDVENIDIPNMNTSRNTTSEDEEPDQLQPEVVVNLAMDCDDECDKTKSSKSSKSAELKRQFEVRLAMRKVQEEVAGVYLNGHVQEVSGETIEKAEDEEQIERKTTPILDEVAHNIRV